MTEIAVPQSTHSARPLASIIVNNYNYGRFLRQAIDSALAQTYSPLEVLVVDDGSTDESREVIESYGDRIVPLLKENGGQASTFNAGFEACNGEVVIFLDADDALLPTAVELAMERFEPGMAKVHWPLWRADATLERTGQQIPVEDLPTGDLRAFTLLEGPATSLSPPTSGNAWARAFLQSAMPIPEEEHRIGADGYLYGLAPGFGTIGSVPSPQGVYRIHQNNNYKHMPIDDRVRAGIRSFEQQWHVLEGYARENGLPVDREKWARSSYFHQLGAAVREIEAVIPVGETIILADEARWSVGPAISGRPVIPFLEQDGIYWGFPEDDEDAIRALERLRTDRSARAMVVAWPAFWWLDHYQEFATHLRSSYTCLLSNERLMIFDLNS